MAASSLVRSVGGHAGAVDAGVAEKQGDPRGEHLVEE
jgi:hypothetical protein